MLPTVTVSLVVSEPMSQHLIGFGDALSASIFSIFAPTRPASRSSAPSPAYAINQSAFTRVHHAA